MSEAGVNRSDGGDQAAVERAESTASDSATVERSPDVPALTPRERPATGKPGEASQTVDSSDDAPTDASEVATTSEPQLAAVQAERGERQGTDRAEAQATGDLDRWDLKTLRAGVERLVAKFGEQARVSQATSEQLAERARELQKELSQSSSPKADRELAAVERALQARRDRDTRQWAGQATDAELAQRSQDLWEELSRGSSPEAERELGAIEHVQQAREREYEQARAERLRTDREDRLRRDDELLRDAIYTHLVEAYGHHLHVDVDALYVAIEDGLARQRAHGGHSSYLDASLDGAQFIVESYERRVDNKRVAIIERALGDEYTKEVREHLRNRQPEEVAMKLAAKHITENREEILERRVPWIRATSPARSQPQGELWNAPRFIRLMNDLAEALHVAQDVRSPSPGSPQVLRAPTRPSSPERQPVRPGPILLRIPPPSARGIPSAGGRYLGPVTGWQEDRRGPARVIPRPHLPPKGR